MKKILSLLFVLVLSLSFIACGSTKVKGELVTDPEDIQNYFEDLEYSDISYKFTIKYDGLEKDYYSKAVEKYTVKGTFNYEEEDDMPVLVSFKYTANRSVKETEATIDGKKKATSTEKASVVFDGEYVYDSYEYKDKSTDYSESDKELTCWDAEELPNTPSLMNLVSGAELGSIVSRLSSASMSGQCFLDGDNMTIVVSDNASHTVIVIKCDGSDIKSIDITVETADSSYSLQIKTCDPVDIEEPKDSSKYEDLEDRD